MNNEQKSQIIKSMAYGLTNEEIAEDEDVELFEIAELRFECQEEIAAEQERQRESGYEWD